MDDRKRATLEMMEEIVEGMEYTVAGKELILQVRDYLDADEESNAHRVLCKIDPNYFDGPIHYHASESKDFAEAVAKVIEKFGIHLSALKSRGYSA